MIILKEIQFPVFIYRTNALNVNYELNLNLPQSTNPFKTKFIIERWYRKLKDTTVTCDFSWFDEALEQTVA